MVIADLEHYEVKTPNSNGYKPVYDVVLVDGERPEVRFVNEDGRLWSYPISHSLLTILELEMVEPPLMYEDFF